MAKKRKRQRWELLPKNDLKLIEDYARAREEFYLASDHAGHNSAGMLRTMEKNTEETFIKLVNLLIRLRRAAKKTKVIIEHQEAPPPPPEPIGQEQSEPMYGVEFREEVSPCLFQSRCAVVDAPTPAHAAALVRRQYGKVEIISVKLQPPKGKTDVTQDPPGQGTTDLGNVGGRQEPDVSHSPQIP